MTRRVLAICQYALPTTQPGITRHAELLVHAPEWEATILCGNVNYSTRQHFTTDDPRFMLIRSQAVKGNGPRRIWTWLHFAVAALLRAMRCPRPDVVYVSSPPLLGLLTGVALKRLRRVPLVIEVRDLWPQAAVEMNALRAGSQIHRILMAVASVAYRSADAVVVVAPGWEDDLVAAGAKPSSITVVPNGASVDALSPTKPRQLLREQHGFRRFTALYAGAQGPINGLDALLDAATECPEVDFVLVGAGVDHDRLVARSSTENISNVRFADPVPKQVLGDLLGAADVGLHVIADLDLHRRAMSPNKLFDYMGAGLPVITNGGPAAGAIVNEAGCGLAVEAAELPVAIKRLMSLSEAERAALGEAGRAAITARYSRQVMGRRLAAVFDHVVDR